MKILIILAATLLAINALPTLQQVHSQWTNFKSVHGKSYNGLEDLKRKSIFANNLVKIEEHNERFAKGETTYRMGVNQFADLTQEEFVAFLSKYKRPSRANAPTEVFVPKDVQPAETADWRPTGAVTAVKNQGQCGSCWAFSTTGSLEGAYFLNNNELISFSEQELVDCSTNSGNEGCNGGYMEGGFEYVIHNGISTEKQYPYEAKDGKCRRNPKQDIKFISAYGQIKKNDEDDLLAAVYQIGPISVAVDASNWHLYQDGILDDTECGNTDDDLNHGVLAVGYGSDNGNDYWLVKNSWGPTFGEEGYIRSARNAGNSCGIATDASYPII